MPDADDTIPHSTPQPLAASVLALPVNALPGVDDAVKAALAGIGVSTVYDLARSAVFSTAVSLATRPGPLDEPPADWVDERYPKDTPPATWPVKTLRAISDSAGEKLQKALKVKNLGELATWPAYRLARQLLQLALGVAAATDGASGAAGFDETVPADLIPGNNLPTESVHYTTLVLGDVHEPAPTSGGGRGGGGAGRSILAAAQLDLTVALAKANAGFQYVAEGALLTYVQSWYSQGVALGDIRKTIPLAAGEVVRVAQRDWTRRQAGTRTEAGTEQEQLTNATTHNRSTNEVAAAVASEAQNGFTGTNASSFSAQAGLSASGGLLGAIVGGPTFSGGLSSNTTNAMTVTGSQGNRTVNSSMQQNINEATHQHASAARNRRATVVEEISESDAATASTRILANYNHAHALNVVFYELVQVCRVETRLRKVDKVLFVPLKMLEFDQSDLTPDEAWALLPHAVTPDIHELLLRYIKGPMAHFPTLPKGPGPDPAPIQPTPAAIPATPGTPIDPLTLTVPPLAAQLNRMRFLQPSLVDSLVRADLEAAQLPLASAPKVTAMQLTGVDAGAQVIATLADGNQAVANVDAAGEAKFAQDLDLTQVLTVTFNPKNVNIKPNATLTLPVLGPTAGITLPIGGGSATTLIEVRGPLNDIERQRLLLHMQRNRVRYNQALWAELDETAIAMLLAGYTYGDGNAAKPLLQWVDPKPVGFVGNYLVFRMQLEPEKVNDGQAPKNVRQEWFVWRRDHGLGDDQLDPKMATSILVSMPTDGLFAEAVLGRANCAEKIDISRFINWHEAPIPILPPEISPVGTSGVPQGIDLKPGQFPTPLVNIVGPTSLPAPTLGQATVNAVANGNIFRDMSAAAATLGLAQGALQASQAGAQSASEQATDLQRQQLQIAGKVAEVAAQAAAAYFTGGASLAGTGLTAAGGLMNAGKKVDASKSGQGGGGTTGGAGRPVGGGPAGPLGESDGGPAGTSGDSGGLVLPPAGSGMWTSAANGVGYEERGFLAALGQSPPPPGGGNPGQVQYASYSASANGGSGLPGLVYEPIDVTLRLFIPAPVVAFPQDGEFLDVFIFEFLYGLLGGDNRTFHPTQGTHRCQIAFRLNPDPTRPTPFVALPKIVWGETRAFKAADGEPVPGRPGWWWQLKNQNAQPFFKDTHAVDDISATVSAQLIADQAQWRIPISINAGIPLEGFKGVAAPSIHAELTLDVRTRPQPGGGPARTEVHLWGLHDGFPAYEMYINGHMLYGYLPETRPNAGPWNLFPPMDVSVSTRSSDLSTQPGFRPVKDLETIQL